MSKNLVYQFGVYQQPSGLENVSRSRQISVDAMVPSSWDLQQIDAQIDANEGAIDRSKNLDTKSIAQSKNLIQRFEEMIRGGWGGAQQSERRDPPRQEEEEDPRKPPSQNLGLGTYPAIGLTGCRVSMWLTSTVIYGGTNIEAASDEKRFVRSGFVGRNPRWEVYINKINEIVGRASGAFINNVNYGVFIEEKTNWFYAQFRSDGSTHFDYERRLFERRQALVPYTFGASAQNAAIAEARILVRNVPWVIYNKYYTDVEFTNCPASHSQKFDQGISSPPPPRKNMECCIDYNLIATIIEDKIANLSGGIKNHIDQRTLEELKSINKMLQGMEIGLNLQPVIDRLNQVETNLWNGPGG